jgi:arylsulfatase A-like enzyme
MGLSGLLVALAGCGAEEPARPPARNLLLITIDTLRADRVGAYGSHLETPNLDRLAREGIRFEQCFTVVPTTTASHAAMLTGVEPRQLGVARNGYRVPESARTVAEAAAEGGYATAAFVSSFALAPQFGLDQGFELYDVGLGERVELDQDWRSAGETSDHAIAWLRDHGRRPFFLWIHYFDPHFPYDPPAPFDTLYDRDYAGDLDGSMETIFGIWRGEIPLSERDARHLTALYEGEISYTDQQLGRVLTALDELGLREQTWVVATSDHGESLGEHEYWFDHGKHLYDTDLRVPLLVRPGGTAAASGAAGRAADSGAHGLLAPGAVIATQVRSLDLGPTLMELLGSRPPEGLTGRSFLGLLHGEPERRERPLLAEATKPHRAERLQVWPNAQKAHAIRSGGWKYIETGYLGRRELYDLGQDPREERSLEGDAAAGVETPGARLREKLRGWLQRGARAPERPTQEDMQRLKTLGYVD